jgi:ArsR family transcriptional regulator, lead/cadmium/zinc/bismuth-responsive transcriptional repressor
VPLSRPPINDDELLLMAVAFKAMSDPSRLRILRVLMNHELCVGELAERTGLSHANTSKHLILLRDARLVTYVRLGNSKRFSLCSNVVPQLCAMLCRDFEPDR